MRYVLMMGTALFSCMAIAEAGTMLNLDAAARMALERAPAFAAALAARDASLEDKNLGLAGLLPFIKGTGEFSHFKQKYSYTQPKSFLASNVVYNRFQFGATLVQPLYRLDRWAGFAKGKLAAEIGELKLSLARQALLMDVAQAYTDVLVTLEDVAAARIQEKAVSMLRVQAATAFQAGTATVNDALEADSRIDLVRADRIQSENNLATARARFESLVGNAHVEPVPFARHLHAGRPRPDDGGHWREAGMHHALSVLISEKKLAVAKQEVTRSLGVALPGIDAVASLGREKETNSLFATGYTIRTEQLGIQMEVPLYAGGGTRAQLRKARKLQVEADYELGDTRRKAGLVANNAYLSVKSAAARMRAFEHGVVSAEMARRAAQAGYEVGLRTIVERLDAEDRLASARRDLVRAKAEYLLARLQLPAAVGRLNLTEIEKANSILLRAEEHGDEKNGGG